MRDISRDILSVMEKYKCNVFIALLILINGERV
jgi:hypothetical protein